MSSLAAEIAASDDIQEHAINQDAISQKGLRLVSIRFERIREFEGHPFRLYTGERLTDMVESIRQNGILMPLIVRRIFGDARRDYEMLSGHNRMNAGKLAGLDSAWCLVKEGLTDEEALMYVIETNLLQRSFADLLPSEKAAVLALRYSEMFSQGKRNDIRRELEELEGGGTCGSDFHKSSEAGTCGTDFHKSNSRDALGGDYDLTGRQVANYLRVNRLMGCLRLKLDDKLLTLASAVSLSYTRVMYVSSATTTWIDGYTTKVYSTDAPQGTIFTAENGSALETVQENGATCYKVDTSRERETGLNANGGEYYGAFKVCIPVDNVADEGSFTIKATGGAAQFNLFLANNPSSTEQSYIISDPAYTTVEASAPFKWSKTGTEDGSASLEIVKTGPGGGPLEGAEFTLTGDRGTTVTGTSGPDGKVTWTGLPADEKFTLTETKAPEGCQPISPMNVTLEAGRTNYMTVCTR